MNYQKVYNQIVERAKLIENERVTLKKQGSYFERHHIVPKCLDITLSKEPTNLVLLTAREHFLCHWLLIHLYVDNHKISYAFWGMVNGRTSKNQKRYVPSSRIYAQSKANISRLGHSSETKNKLKISHTDVHLSTAHKDNISKGVLLALSEGKGRYWKGKTSHRKGKTISESVKSQISKSKKGKPAHNKGISMSDEARQRMSDAKKGKTSHRKGKTLTEEHKRNLRLAKQNKNAN